MANETKTEAIRRALAQRGDWLQARSGKPRSGKKLRDYLERNVWPMMPPDELGRVISRKEEDRILGYGPGGF